MAASAFSIALEIVANGSTSVPGLSSLPVVATQKHVPKLAVISNGAVGVKVTDADTAEMPDGSVPVQPKNSLPESGVAVTVTGMSSAYQAVPDGETEPPASTSTVPFTLLVSHCHSSRRYAAESGCV